MREILRFLFGAVRPPLEHNGTYGRALSRECNDASNWHAQVGSPLFRARRSEQSAEPALKFEFADVHASAKTANAFVRTSPARGRTL